MKQQNTETKQQKQVKTKQTAPVVNETEIADRTNPSRAAYGDSFYIQAARLDDPRLHTEQRQALATQIGRVQGNRHLQRVIASLPGDRAQGMQPEWAGNIPLKTSSTTAVPAIQRGFFGSLWKGVKSVGGAIASGAKAVGGAVATGAKWVGERVGDAAMWVTNLIRDLPARLARLGQTLWEGLGGVISFIPEAIQALASGGLRGFGDWLWERAKSGGTWILTLLSRVFDTLGGPEIAEFITHMLTKATPLTGPEIAAASSVLGPSAVRYEDVRIAEGGLLNLIFKFNEGRAFTTWHTINMASSGDHTRANLAIVVHEITHVYQDERVGTRYMGQAIHAQNTVGYGYGDAAGLVADRAAGKQYRDYNREQQAQIAQDYYTLQQSSGDTSAYDPFITELRAGDL